MIGFYILFAFIALFTIVGAVELYESRDHDEFSEPIPRPQRRGAGFKR